MSNYLNISNLCLFFIVYYEFFGLKHQLEKVLRFVRLRGNPNGMIKETGASILMILMTIGRIAAQQTQSDSYTKCELLDPSSNSFRIIYDVSATTERAQFYFNTLRKGSEHKVDYIYDLMTGKELEWEIVKGAMAKGKGHSSTSEDTDYLKVNLARPVPKDGESRIRIDKTYKDPKSYYEEKEQLIFERSLGIKRNSVVLPEGYELIGCNYPSQIEMVEGCIKVSFFNRGNDVVKYKIIAKKLPLEALLNARSGEPMPWADYIPQPQGRDKSKARLDYELNERAFQDREIVYYLQSPETHSFRLYHDYTRAGKELINTSILSGWAVRLRTRQPTFSILEKSLW